MAAPDRAGVEAYWGGCHLTRPISAAYRDAGFVVDQAGARYVPKTPRWAGWIEWGTARLA